MADTNKKEYTSNLHPKGDMDTTVYPNVKSENIIDKDTAAYTAGKVPDSSLVSRSLDGISENLETAKIQVEANKNNIETLQGNYTGLQHQVNTNSSDIALTKTQVETNKTNIAKNTQDIENLNAVMPTGINVDANGYAVLEHDGTEITGQTKKVKFAQTDKSASFNEVTIPTATALKTKDGTTFGGGSSIYNGTEFLPTFDIATLKDIYLPLTGGHMKGDFDLDGNNLNFYYYSRNGRLGKTSLAYYPIDFLNSPNVYTLSIDYCGSLIFNYRQFYLGFFNDDRNIYTFVGIDEDKGLCLASQSNNGTIRLMSYDKTTKKITHEFKMSNTSSPTIDNSPIITKATLVTHTVEIHYASNGSYFCFTGQSDNNTTIDSVEKLTTVFANRDLCGVGVFGSAGLSKIHVGTSVNDTTFKKYMNNGEYANPSEETFATVFNTTGFTITDSVSAL